MDTKPLQGRACASRGRRPARGILFCGALLAVSIASKAEPSMHGHPDWTLVWQDEFEGDSIDPAKWNFVVAGGGFGNNESQHYTDRAENAFLRDGHLVIRALREEYGGHAYTSAKLTTEGKGAWTYGRFEIRARLPIGQGIWPAIWMMPEPATQHGHWPIGGEIDIMEVVGYAPRTLHGTLHYGNPWKNTGGSTELQGDATFADDFHLFAMEWAPGAFRWYLDGALYHAETNWYTSAPDALWPAPFDRPFYVQLNVAVGGNWPGYPNETTPFPAEMAVDYVRVYAFNGKYPPVESRPATPERQTPRGPTEDGNLIYNGAFEQGQEFWKLGQHEGGRGRVELEAGAAHVQIEQAGEKIYSVQWMQGPLDIRQGRSYRVSFRARAEAPRDVTVNVGKASQHWDTYSGGTTVAVDTEWKDFTFDFTMQLPSDPVARLEFNLGLSDVDVWLDDVAVRAL